MDRREAAAAAGPWYDHLDEKRMVAVVLIEVATEDDETEEGGTEETEVEIPVEFEVCGTCGGKGKHTNPSVDAHGITEDEWGQWSPEEQESYLSGGYDVECYECAGRRVVPVPAVARMTEEQKGALERAMDLCWDRLMDHRTRMLESGIHD